MNKFYHSVYLFSDRCSGCFTCLKRCPTQAIRIRDGKAFIISQYCIDCGECYKHCPHHAKRCRRDEFAKVRAEFPYLVALPAPTLYSQFNHLEDVNIVLTAILPLRFRRCVRGQRGGGTGFRSHTQIHTGPSGTVAAYQHRLPHHRTANPGPVPEPDPPSPSDPTAHGGGGKSLPGSGLWKKQDCGRMRSASYLSLPARQRSPSFSLRWDWPGAMWTG